MSLRVLVSSLEQMSSKDLIPKPLQNGDRHLSNEDINMYWDIREASKIHSWLLECIEKCVP